MSRASTSFWSRLRASVTALLLSPVVLLLALGRIVFFSAVDVAKALRQISLEISDMPLPAQARARLLPFWGAWTVAMALLAAGIGCVALVVKNTSQLTAFDQWVARGAAVGLAFIAFHLAFRMALLGTAALQRALAHNLAMLVSFELAELKAEATERARILAVGGNSPAFRLPHFREEREDIVKLLGHPTEEALRRLLHSLEAYNSAIAGDNHRLAATRMHAELAEVDIRLRQAFSAIDPFCRRTA